MLVVFFLLQPSGAKGFYYIIYTVLYSVICRPSDHTVQTLHGPRYEPRRGGLEAGTLTPRPQHLLFLLVRKAIQISAI